jgi:tripartite-type tricarboxylate transporter receptor subunit TctC
MNAMEFQRIGWRVSALLIVFAPFLSPGAWSQAGPIKITVQAPAGGVTDVSTRLLGDQIHPMQGRTIVIENRPGATTVIGTEAVARKTPRLAVSDLAGWFNAAMQVSDVRAKPAAIGLFPTEMCGADFGAFIRRQYEEYGRVIREVHFKAQ